MAQHQAAARLPDTPPLHKVTDINTYASFPFDDIILTGNVIPGSSLQNLMPPLEVHMNSNYKFRDQSESESESESENEYNNNNNFFKPPKHAPNNEFPPTLARRIEIAERKRKKKKKKKQRTEAEIKDERNRNFLSAPRKGKPLETLCPRSLEIMHGWKQTLFPGLLNNYRLSKIIINHLKSSQIITDHHWFTRLLLNTVLAC